MPGTGAIYRAPSDPPLPSSRGQQGLAEGAAPAIDARRLLFGRDDTPGIVSVSASRDGRARVWRRVADPDGGPSRVVLEEDRFPSWLFLADASILASMKPERLDRRVLDEGVPEIPNGIAVVDLQGGGVYRHLVLTSRMAEVESRAVAAYRKRSGGAPTRGLSDLRGVVYARPLVEQYLAITGRTYFKGMTFQQVRRMQFDLETTGLDPDRDTIFMISIADSDGLRLLIDVDQYDEAGLIRKLVEVIQERDPDVLENHNIFGFDLTFLVKRARALGVDFALGRDGTAPSSYQDVVKVGEKTDSFTRWAIAGREVVDTLHAVRRYGAIVRDMRHQGLKEAARYFGVAKDDREYVPGPEIWPTFQRDPERVRRYAMDDVIEVDELSRLLHATPFSLAQMVPKPYERIATSGTGQGLIEPLLVRAYLTHGRALPGGTSRGGSYAGGRTELFTSGVVRHVVKADVASLYPSLMLTYKIGPKSDHLGAFLALLRELTALRLQHKAAIRLHPAGSLEAHAHEAASGAMKQLINSFYGSLGTSFALFGDLDAAGEVTRRGRDVLGQMLQELEQRGMLLVEADTDGVLFGVPDSWTEDDERHLIEQVGQVLPAGISVEHDGRYLAMYSYAEKNYILQRYDGQVRLVGGSFRSSRSERYGEQFLRSAAPLLLAGQFEALRALYLDTVARLRGHAVPIEELCLSVILSKSPDAYAKSGRREEQYEVLVMSGRKWKPGDRVTYYQARGGRKKLVDEHAGDEDAEYYVRRLKEVYAQKLSRALTREDFEALFGENLSLWETDLGAIKPLTTRERTPTAF
ncbi:MAG: DNA polymerase domain-containing protein [Chloroflexota bacterium]